MTNVTTTKAEAAYAFLVSKGEGYIQTKYDEETGLANTSRSSLKEVFSPSCTHTLMALKGGCAIRPDPEPLTGHKPAQTKYLLREEISKKYQDFPGRDEI